MRRARIGSAIAVAAAILAGNVHAAGFTYHGNLQDGGRPAEGAYDIELTLYSAPTGGHVVAGPLTLYAVPVHAGAFSTAVDFGVAGMAADAALAVRLRPAGQGGYVALDARTPVATVRASETASSVCPGAWTLNGNAGNTAGMYLGTADAQPLTLETNGSVGMQIGVPGISTTSAAAGRNVVLGDSANSVDSGAVAAFVAGGGSMGAFLPNHVVLGGDFGVIGGGVGNTVAGRGATVSGGYVNSAYGQGAVVPGGQNNRADAGLSFAAGTYAVVRDAAAAGTTYGDTGSFVWSDGTGTSLAPFTSSGPNQFIVRSGGGVGINRTPLNSNVEMTITTSATGSNSTVDLALMPKNSTWGYDIAVNGTGENDDAFGIFKTNGSNFSSYLALNASGDLFIAGSHAIKASGTTWENPSDARIKQDIEPIAHAIDTLLRLNPVSFHYTQDYRETESDLPDKAYLGFVAQDYAKVFPEAVRSTGRPLPGDPTAAPILSIDANPALITTVAAVRELAERQHDEHDEIDRLRSENADLRARLDALLARVRQIEGAEER